jgi:NIPSNAP
MNDVRYPILELRQYTLRPGQRDVLINLFDREFVETQEDVGMPILGQFRDLDRPDRFVWLRGFHDMPSRAHGLASFYGGPVWKAHNAEANATMVDSGNVLLRPVTEHSGFPAPSAPRPPIGSTTPPPSRVLTTIYYRDHPFDEAFMDVFEQELRPVLVETGATPLACFQTEYAENNFPGLPVRTGENVFVWFACFPSQAHLSDHLHRLDRSDRWRDRALPTLSAMLISAPEQLRLAPTARSLLR